MSGHSKWNNIKNRKGAVDAARAKTFSDIAKQIRVAVKTSGAGDPRSNPTLKLLFDKARAANMPNEKVQRAIEAGLGRSSAGEVHHIVYEAFGPGGVAFMVATNTDNPNRTSSEIRYIFSRAGGSLAGPGAAQYLFQRSSDGEGYTPTMPMAIEDRAQQQQLQDLIEELTQNEAVEDVFHSATWSEMG